MAPPAKPAAAPALDIGNLNGPTQIAVVLGLVVLVLGGYYLAFYGGLERDLASERARQGTLGTQMSAVRRDERQYNDDVAELNRRRNRARDMQRVLPDSADMPGFMRNINTLAESSGLQIRLIQPSDEHVEQYFVRVPVRLEVSGTYLALGRFFRAVSQLPRVINMENISLEQPTLENGDVRLSARVLATTFRALTSREQRPATPAGRR